MASFGGIGLGRTAASRARRRRSLAALVATGLLLAVPGAGAERRWAPAGEAAVHPGVQLLIPLGDDPATPENEEGRAQCTAAFVLADAEAVYLATAAHCFQAPGGTAAEAPPGCNAAALPDGTPVEIRPAGGDPRVIGELAYNSWSLMQFLGEGDERTCASNDFALVRLDGAIHDEVNPSVPVWGGPVSLGDGTDALEKVYSYGASALGLGLLGPKEGYSLGVDESGWEHLLYALTPGIPGDSGSGIVDAQGNAVGVLSTLVFAPYVGANTAVDLRRALTYLKAFTEGFDQIQLVPGTESFAPGLLP